MKTKNEYIEILATELREVSAQIDELTTRTNYAINSMLPLKKCRNLRHTAVKPGKS
jgi:hypothetical protein